MYIKVLKPIILNSSALTLEVRYSEWDTRAIGHPVMEIKRIEIRDIQKARTQLSKIIEELSLNKTALISCRIPHEFLRESMVLENVGFKFIETILHPFTDRLYEKEFVSDKSILIEEAKEGELVNLSKIAQISFKSDRLTVDYRIPENCSGIRYKNWLLSCKNHSHQKVYKFSKNKKIVGFFIVEEDFTLRNAYWNLTAISPKYQGKGLGRKCWEAMLSYYQSLNFNEVSTTISARNSPVLNLYSKLNFRFRNPEMTFHWVNNQLVEKR